MIIIVLLKYWGTEMFFVLFISPLTVVGRRYSTVVKYMDLGVNQMYIQILSIYWMLKLEKVAKTL